MPTGKVKWFSSEKGFGFLSRDDGDDVFVHRDALPSGVTELKPGSRVEFGVAQGRRGEQALSVRVLDPIPSLAKAHKTALMPFYLDGVAGNRELNIADGMHPNPKGAAIVADNLWPVLEPLLTAAAASPVAAAGSR